MKPSGGGATNTVFAFKKITAKTYEILKCSNIVKDQAAKYVRHILILDRVPVRIMFDLVSQNSLAVWYYVEGHSGVNIYKRDTLTRPWPEIKFHDKLLGTAESGRIQPPVLLQDRYLFLVSVFAQQSQVLVYDFGVEKATRPLNCAPHTDMLDMANHVVFCHTPEPFKDGWVTFKLRSWHVETDTYQEMEMSSQVPFFQLNLIKVGPNSVANVTVRGNLDSVNILY